MHQFAGSHAVLRFHAGVTNTLPCLIQIEKSYCDAPAKSQRYPLGKQTCKCHGQCAAHQCGVRVGGRGGLPEN